MFEPESLHTQEMLPVSAHSPSLFLVTTAFCGISVKSIKLGLFCLNKFDFPVYFALGYQYGPYLLRIGGQRSRGRRTPS